ncbi:hypothetical protein [Actinomadura algeriensis]|uniref:Uncharacterized protein n=1 Tax=Actinomadura algeriensis TaxID=1679523 RepID=A0ABR9JIT9_9ACTN|nr:hypothetical protein [Actinomadura algeriensis]MBE1530466.1 hypothetical protein [Actinomadura algeriensis]
MRSRYAPRTSSPDLSIELPDRLGTDYPKTAVAVALARFGADELLRRYQDRAAANSAAHGCANCMGIEAFKSCMAAASALNVQGGAAGNLTALSDRYRASVAGTAFGACASDLYRDGLRGDDGEPLNPFKQAWYGTLRTRRAELGGGAQFWAVTKSSANAHAVLARKTLETAFRFALCEYLAAPSGKTHRDAARVAGQSMLLAGGTPPTAEDTKALAARWDALMSQYGNVYAGGPLKGGEQVLLVQGLMDGLVDAAAAAFRDRRDAWPVRRARIAALCTLHRLLILWISRNQRLYAPSLAEPMAGILRMISCGDAETNINVASYDLENIHSALDNVPVVGAPSIAGGQIREMALQWQNEGRVEFGHGCGTCENAQGDGDLVRRALDFAAAQAPTPTPVVGVTFTDLGFAPDGDTVWDLSNAVACEAFAVFYGTLCNSRARSQEGPPADFRETVAYHLSQTAPLFTGYLQALLLELSVATAQPAPRRAVKILSTDG